MLYRRWLSQMVARAAEYMEQNVPLASRVRAPLIPPIASQGFPTAGALETGGRKKPQPFLKKVKLAEW